MSNYSHLIRINMMVIPLSVRQSKLIITLYYLYVGEIKIIHTKIDLMFIEH